MARRRLLFGLAAARVLGAPTPSHSERAEKPSIVSDVTSLLGTAFLWLYWPSFVAGALPPGSSEASLAIIHTVLALVGSTLVTFAVSALTSRGRLRPVDVQNATLAGGVAIGAVADLPIRPIGAIAIGSVAGLVSTLGYKLVQPCLLEKLRLHDTCGVHNLHGIPAILGGLASIILPLCVDLHGIANPGTQAVATFLTMLVAIVTGAITGAVMALVKKLEGEHGAFVDSPFWEAADDFPNDV